MIERQFITQNMKEYLIQEYIAKTLSNVGLSHTKLVKTPSGVKIIIYASRPGLIVGRKGANIKELTMAMKNKFKLENPQIEIAEIENINIDPQLIAEKIVSSMERFGTQRFKGIVHKVLSEVMGAGARGIEVVISGKIPGARAKRWRFSAGYLKKCGDIAMNYVKKSIMSANLKTGTVGVQVKIMPPDVKLPDDITIYDETKVEEKAAAEKKADEEKSSGKKRGRKNRDGHEESKHNKPDFGKAKMGTSRQSEIGKEAHKHKERKQEVLPEDNKSLPKESKQGDKS